MQQIVILAMRTAIWILLAIKKLVRKIRQRPRAICGSPVAGPSCVISGSMASDTAAIGPDSLLSWIESSDAWILGPDLLSRGVKLNGFNPGSLIGSLESLMNAFGSVGWETEKRFRLGCGTSTSSTRDESSSMFTKQESSISGWCAIVGSPQTESVISPIPRAPGPHLVRDSGVNAGASGLSFVSE